jgi:hypothetical protein
VEIRYLYVMAGLVVQPGHDAATISGWKRAWMTGPRWNAGNDKSQHA